VLMGGVRMKAQWASLISLGVAVVVAMTFAPQVIATVSRVRAARRLRGRYLLVPFEATWNGAAVVVTGVLDRTAVVHLVGTEGAPEDRKLARRSQLFVAPGSLRWALPVRWSWRSGFGTQPHRVDHLLPGLGEHDNAVMVDVLSSMPRARRTTAANARQRCFARG